MNVQLYCNGHEIGAPFVVTIDDDALPKVKEVALLRMDRIMRADPDTASCGGSYIIEIEVDGEEAGQLTINISGSITTPY